MSAEHEKICSILIAKSELGQRNDLVPTVRERDPQRPLVALQELVNRALATLLKGAEEWGSVSEAKHETKL
jgi:hypothetical protein